jgi:hypothetical protein
MLEGASFPTICREFVVELVFAVREQEVAESVTLSDCVHEDTPSVIERLGRRNAASWLSIMRYPAFVITAFVVSSFLR